ncbi:hypothetical protein SAMN05444162_3076 [Paenibacillaceae bacterium GAS479]|nr:hypothetical protein SAMN05444162_3076 [Paenibacillaceae bacterium GAS479]
MKLTRELTNDIETRLKRAVFVGRLMTEEELAFSVLEPVWEDNQEFLLFHIKCLSDIPDELAQYFMYQNRIFRGSTRSANNIQKIRSQLVPNFDRLRPEEQRSLLQQRLENKLLLFSLYTINTNVFLDIMKIEDITEPNFEERYEIIAGPQLNLKERRGEFEERMKESRPFVLPCYPDLFRSPGLVYFDKTLYSELELKTSGNAATYYLQNQEEVRCLEVDTDFFDNIQLRHGDYIYVVASTYYHKKLAELKKNGFSLRESKNRREERARNKPLVKEQQAVSIENREQLSQLFTGQEMDVEGSAVKADEGDFLAQLLENATAKGLYFDQTDLVNVHTSIKTNMLTIIGGMSGTGKSHLALLYGETLGLQYGKHVKLIPISPSYHEPGDLLGFMNPATGIYQESETGLISLLIEAQSNPEQLYMVIFDEMNLAQVEHWFSPFISLLELEKNKRCLQLYHPRVPCRNAYPSEVVVGDNVIFVGTVNFDETTKSFSHRLLDRANVIAPRKLSFREVRNMQQDQVSGSYATVRITKSTLRNVWMNRSVGEISDLSEEEVILMDLLHETLQKNDSQLGISFRVILAIAHYVSNIPSMPNGLTAISRGTALDIQLKQRVFSKLSGMETTIGALVGTYHGENYEGGFLTETLQSAESQQISDFEQSIEFLKKKAKELTTHGYAN